jgi:hypothetical protein
MAYEASTRPYPPYTDFWLAQRGMPTPSPLKCPPFPYICMPASHSASHTGCTNGVKVGVGVTTNCGFSCSALLHGGETYHELLALAAAGPAVVD